MFRGRFLFTAAVAIVLLGLLAAAGFGLVRLGWSQGYAAGLLAEGAELAQPIYGLRYWGPGFFGGGFFSLLCGVGLFFFIGMFLLRFLFFGRHIRAWKRAGGPSPEGWHEGWGQWGHGPRSPRQEGPPSPEAETPEAAQTGDESPIETA